MQRKPLRWWYWYTRVKNSSRSSMWFHRTAKKKKKKKDIECSSRCVSIDIFFSLFSVTGRINDTECCYLCCYSEHCEWCVWAVLPDRHGRRSNCRSADSLSRTRTSLGRGNSTLNRSSFGNNQLTFVQISHEGAICCWINVCVCVWGGGFQHPKCWCNVAKIHGKAPLPFAIATLQQQWRQSQSELSPRGSPWVTGAEWLRCILTCRGKNPLPWKRPSGNEQGWIQNHKASRAKFDPWRGEYWHVTRRHSLWWCLTPSAMVVASSGGDGISITLRGSPLQRHTSSFHNVCRPHGVHPPPPHPWPVLTITNRHGINSSDTSCSPFLLFVIVSPVDEAHCCDTSRSSRLMIGQHSKATSS